MASLESPVTNEAVIAEIVQFGRDGHAQPDETRSFDFNCLHQLYSNLVNALQTRVFVLGCQLPEKHRIQVTTDHDVKSFHQDTGHTFGTSLADTVQRLVPGPLRIIYALLDRPTLGLNGPATANVVEYAMINFSPSRTTPEFKARIEKDHVRFGQISAEGMEGRVGQCYGWVVTQHRHPSTSQEKAQGFLVITGWNSVDHFRRSTSSEAFKEALPIFHAWEASAEVVSHIVTRH